MLVEYFFRALKDEVSISTPTTVTTAALPYLSTWVGVYNEAAW